MRLFAALVLVLAACGARSKAPAWPEMAEREEDGGESLAPRQPSLVAEVSKETDDDEEAKPAATTEPAAAKPAEETKTETTAPTMGPAVVAPEEVINIDEIVIEIED